MTQKKRMNATKKADALFSAHIRARGFCEMAELWPDLRCKGAYQCCHVHSRRYRAIRWNGANALCACQAHHFFQGLHPLEFEAQFREVWSGEMWDDLKHMALNDPPMDPYAVIERLKESA